MAKFRILAKVIDYVYIDIEAVDEDEVKEVYEELDGSEFHNDGFGSFELMRITPLDDNDDVDFTADEILRPE